MKKEKAYEILEITSDASEVVIRKAYKQIALKTHPDKNRSDPEAKVKFQQVSEAYKCLTDPSYVDEEGGDVELSEEEMFEMFNQMFCK
jgi:DnaJ-class molecular chaperone